MLRPQSKKMIACAIVSTLSMNLFVFPMDKLSSSCPTPTTVGTWKLPKTKSMTFPPAGKRKKSQSESLAEPLLVATSERTIARDNSSIETSKFGEETAPLGFQREHSRSFATAIDFDEQRKKDEEIDMNIEAENKTKLEQLVEITSNQKVNFALGALGGISAAAYLVAKAYDVESPGLDALYMADAASAIMQGVGIQGLQFALSKTQTNNQLDQSNETSDRFDVPDLENNLERLTKQPAKKALSRCQRIKHRMLACTGAALSLFGLGVATTYFYDAANPDWNAPDLLYEISAALGLSQALASVGNYGQIKLKQKIEQRQKQARARRGTGESVELDGRDLSFARLPDMGEISSRGSCELYGQTLGTLDHDKQMVAIQQPLLTGESAPLEIPARENQ